MTIVTNVASKLTVAFVAAAMLFTLATPAKAATVEELQAQIAALMAQISSLSGGSSSSSAAACTFTRALTVGAEGADVKCLQDYLTSTGHFTNAGGSTGYFGPVTASAVAAWQTANGVSPAAGYFGSVSQAKYSALMAAAPSTGDDHSDDEDDHSTGELSGEASLDNMEIDSASDDEVEEGQEDAEVGVVTLEFADGDAEVTRMDVAFATAISGADVWDVLDEVSLWVDGDEIARVSASDEDDYQDEDDGTLRFSGLDLIAMEDEEVEITIAATIQNTVDSADQGAYTVAVDSIRFVDADDVTDTISSGEEFGQTVSFEIDDAGAEDELIVKSADSDPDATTIQLEDDAKSDWETVFAFDLDTDDSVNDINVTDLRVDFAMTEDGSTATSSSLLVDDVRIMYDGDDIGDVTINHGTTASATVEFDDELMIDAGDRVTVEVQVKFKALAASLEGATIEATIDTDGLEAEGGDDLTAGQKSGSATGEEHTLRTEGAIVGIDTMSTSKDANTADDATDDEGIFVIKFEVTAFENDLYVNKTAASSSALSGTAGVNFIVEDSAGIQVAAGTSSGSLSSSAKTEGTQFKVEEGDTETFTLTVEYDPATSNFYQLQLVSFNFKAGATGNPDNWQAVLPAEDYQTNQQSI